jgi:uncharacterized cupredoxin-like copper-binding protein
LTQQPTCPTTWLNVAGIPPGAPGDIKEMLMLGRRRTIATLACAALLLAGCNGGGDGAGDGDAATGGDDGGAAGPTELTVTATEFAFEPADVTAAADTDVTITLVNEGALEHEWAVIEQGSEISSEDEFSDDIVAFEVEAIEGGETAEDTFNLGAGTYQVVCAVPGHLDSGMEGSLTLE